MTVPYYYSRLAPFREEFRKGFPILTYHHIALPPRGTRVKSLYLSPKRFARQLQEIRSAGFSTADFRTIVEHSSSGEDPTEPIQSSIAHRLQSTTEPPQAMAATLAPPAEVASAWRPGNPERRMYLAFDDGFCDAFETALPLLLQNRCHSIQYLVSNLLGKTNEWQLTSGDVREPLMDVEQIRDWLAAGQEIGAHTRTHPRLTQLSLAAAREEITGSRKLLEDLFGIRVEHFCYPYGDWNKTIRDLVIEAGFKTACTTDRGLNTPEISLFELKRFIARYEGRTLKTLWKRLRVRLGLIKE